jgi:hypothetical protein
MQERQRRATVSSPARALKLHVENLRYYLEHALEEAVELQSHVGEDISAVDDKLSKLAEWADEILQVIGELEGAQKSAR